MVEIQNDNDGEHQTNIEMVLITDRKNIDVNSTDEQGLNTLKRKRYDIWDTKTHWQFAKKAQAMVDGGDGIETTDTNNDWEYSRNMEI
jgi:hypothetical protein